MEILGIDIGGSGIKGAPVDIKKGEMTAERFRIDTPQPSKPKAVAEVVGQIAKHFDWQGPIGCTFPAIVQHGVVWSAANVDKEWIGTNGEELFKKSTGCPLLLFNDADAAGIAEFEFGAGRGQDGVVLIITFGTGIGSALFNRGVLVPNTELGHLEIRGKDAEERTSDRIRQEKDLSWEKWAERVNEYINYLEALFSPDLFVIGGGVSKKHEKFIPLLHTRAPVVPAQFFNDAGIIGAALAAQVLV